MLTVFSFPSVAWGQVHLHPADGGGGCGSVVGSAVSRAFPTGDKRTGAGGDDDPQALRYLRDILTRAGYALIVTGDLADVPRLMAEHWSHLALLDMVLPGDAGIQLMHDILKTADLPVIFVSSYGQDEMVARALDMGTVDYLVKPFSPTELAARIRAALRKRLEAFPGEPPARSRAWGGLSIDYAQRLVAVDGEPVELTATEYAVLYELAVHAPLVLSESVLQQRVWGPSGWERAGWCGTW